MTDQGASEEAANDCPKGCPLRDPAAPPLVLIPLADYQALVAAKKKSDLNTLSFKQLSKPARSTVERDPEVAVFITLSLGLMPVREIVRQVRKRFGRRRTPSTQAVYRYWDKIRSQAEAEQV